jgi:hypothetical protein
LYAAAISFEADGRRVLATGDQQGGGEGDQPDTLNYQYRNRFRIDDYVESAELYARLRPELLITGHWAPRRVTDGYLDALLADGHRLADLHRALLPLAEVDFGAEGFGARIVPYRVNVLAGESVEFAVELRNPFAHEGRAVVRLALPSGWSSTPVSRELQLEPGADGCVTFSVAVAGSPGRQVIAADLTVGDTPFGEQAEALITVA